MSSFTTPLRVEAMDDGCRWVILEPFVYSVGEEGSTDKIEVPAGLITDFASIPRIFWTLIGGPWGGHGKAAVLHDYLYFCQGDIGNHPKSRLECDKIFLEAMGVLKVPWLRRWTMFTAVRSFGWRAWNLHKKRGGGV